MPAHLPLSVQTIGLALSVSCCSVNPIGSAFVDVAVVVGSVVQESAAVVS